jgi:hypothetical protein
MVKWYFNFSLGSSVIGNFDRNKCPGKNSAIFWRKPSIGRLAIFYAFVIFV